MGGVYPKCLLGGVLFLLFFVFLLLVFFNLKYSGVVDFTWFDISGPGPRRGGSGPTTRVADIISDVDSSSELCVEDVPTPPSENGDGGVFRWVGRHP